MGSCSSNTKADQPRRLQQQNPSPTGVNSSQTEGQRLGRPLSQQPQDLPIVEQLEPPVQKPNNLQENESPEQLENQSQERQENQSQELQENQSQEQQESSMVSPRRPAGYVASPNRPFQSIRLQWTSPGLMSTFSSVSLGQFKFQELNRLLRFGYMAAGLLEAFSRIPKGFRFDAFEPFRQALRETYLFCEDLLELSQHVPFQGLLSADEQSVILGVVQGLAACVTLSGINDEAIYRDMCLKALYTLKTLLNYFYKERFTWPVPPAPPFGQQPVTGQDQQDPRVPVAVKQEFRAHSPRLYSKQQLGVLTSQMEPETPLSQEVIDTPQTHLKGQRSRLLISTSKSLGLLQAAIESKGLRYDAFEPFLLTLRETYEMCVSRLKENEQFPFDWYRSTGGTTLTNRRYLSSSERDVLLGAVFGLAGSVTFTGIGAEAYYTDLYHLTHLKLKKLAAFLKARERGEPLPDGSDVDQPQRTFVGAYFNTWPVQGPQYPGSPQILPFQTAETDTNNSQRAFVYAMPTYPTYT